MFKRAEPKTLPEEHNISDLGMLFPIEYEYAMTGVRDGWLVYISGYRDYRGVVVHTYRHKT